MLKFSIAALCVAFSFAPAFAGVPIEGATDAPDAPACCLLEAGHLVELEIVDPLNSWGFKRGDGFQLRVAQSVLVDGHELVPAGTPVRGEVVHAAAARGGGAPGELLLAARSLDIDGLTIRLRGLKLGGTGDDNSGMALGVSFAAGPFAMFIRGTEIEVPAGTRVHARIAETLTVAPPTPSPEPSIHTEPELP